MFCENCGKTLPEGAAFCDGCGTHRAPPAGAVPNYGTAGNAGNPAGGPQYAAGNPGPQYANQNPNPGNYQNNASYGRGVNRSQYAREYNPQDIDQNKAASAVGYLVGILFFLPLIAAPNSRFGRFHANQMLVLMMAWFLVWIPAIIPILGWLASGVAYIFLIVVSIMGFVYTLQGRAWRIPIIGGITIINP